MSSFLPNGMDWIILAAGVLFVVLGFVLIVGGIKIRRGDKIAYIRKQSLETGVPVIKIIDMAGIGVSVLGTTDKDNPIYFKDEKLSLRVRPSFLDTAEFYYDDGVKTYIYQGMWYFPNGVLGLKCLADMEDMVYKQFPELSFITSGLDIVLNTLIYDGETLKYNCKMLLKDYEQSEYLMKDGMPVIETEIAEGEPYYNADDEPILDENGDPICEEIEMEVYDENNNPVYVKNPDYMTEDRLLETIKKARSVVKSQNIRPGFVNIRTASALIPGRADGQRLDTLMKLAAKQRDILNASKEKWAMYMMYSAFAAFGGVGLVYLIYVLIQKG